MQYPHVSLLAIDFAADVLRELNFFAERAGEVVGDYPDPCHLAWHGEIVHQLRRCRVTVETPATLCGTVNEFLAWQTDPPRLKKLKELLHLPGEPARGRGRCAPKMKSAGILSATCG